MPSANRTDGGALRRIAIVTRRFSWDHAGGGEVSVTLLAHRLAALGHDVTVLAVETQGAPSGAPAGLDVRSIPRLSLGVVREALKGIAPDVAHSYNMESATATVIAAKSLGIPVVVTVNSAWATCLFADMYRPGHGICNTCTIGGVRQCFERRPPESIGRRVPAVVGWGEVQRRLLTLKRADRLTVLSDAARDLLVRNGVPATLVRVVPNFANATPVEGHADEDASMSDGERILYVGALTHPKGVDVLVDAFGLLARRRPDATLEIVGEGRARDTLEARARELGVADRVAFEGYVPHGELPQRYRRARAVAFPIRSEEAFGRIILEAWGAGVPVVASRVSAPPTIIEDGESGLLVPPEDPAALADALERVLADGALARRLTAGGREALPTYAPERVVPRLLAVYEEAIAARRGSS